MSRLQIDQLTSGMVLAEEVKTKAGRLLLTQGIELTENHLKIFYTWGIQEVAIATKGDEIGEKSTLSSAEITPEQMEMAMDEVRPIFSQVDLNHPLFVELFQLAAQKKVLEGSEQ